MAARILVVDDDPFMRDMLVQALTPDDYEIVTAVNGLEALQRIAMQLPDMILLDISMSPGPDGYEVCRQLKADQHTTLIPITFLTAHADLEQRRYGIAAGADDYLSKPVSQDLLRAHVRSQLRLKKLIDQLEPAESMYFTLARDVAAKDGYSTGHLRRMEHYCGLLASQMGITGDDLAAIRYASILYDIGKIRIRDAVLTKRGVLTAAEFAEFKRHPEHGAQMISHMRFARKVAPIVLAHHEYWDGSGYPNGLRGGEYSHRRADRLGGGCLRCHDHRPSLPTSYEPAGGTS